MMPTNDYGSFFLHARIALAVTVVLFASCGRSPYIPLQLLTPTSSSDAAVAIGSTRWELRAGDEWLELEIQNTGDSAVALALGEARYLSPDGRAKNLIEAQRIPTFIEAARKGPQPPFSDRTGTDKRDRLPAPRSAPGSPGTHAAGHVRLDAGGTGRWTLYPVDNVAVDHEGHFRVRPLFRQHTSNGDGPSPVRFVVLVPARIDGEWEIVQLAARCWPRGRRVTRQISG